MAAQASLLLRDPPRVPACPATGVSTAFGTFGELLQGTLPERDGDFLVTLPIACWTRVAFRTDPHGDGVQVTPAHKFKAQRLAGMVLASAGAGPGGWLSIDSSLPDGKGMASSSADLVATARAVANALAIHLLPERIESFLRRIEPTDGVLYPEVVAYHHRVVRLRARLGPLRPMAIVAVDEGGVVDTVEFNRIEKPFSAADRCEFARLLDRLARALAADDVVTIGEVATRSAIINQVLLPKRSLPAMLRICEEFGGLGVATAHSGTMIGILLDPSSPDCAHKLAAVANECYALAGHVHLYHTLAPSRQRR